MGTEPRMSPSLAGRFARGELVAAYCAACDLVVWPPRAACPRCLGSGLEERELSGRGRVLATALVHRTHVPELEGETPFRIATVVLEEGPELVARVEGDPVPGQSVAVRPGSAPPRFARVPESG